MENEIKYILSFKGSKQELHTRLKKWCKKDGQSIKTTLLDLIKKHLEEQNKDN